MTKSRSFILIVLIVPCLKCRFSRFRKYLVFFSPSLYHLVLDLKIAPLVRTSIIFSSSSLLSFNCSSRCEESVSPVVLLSSSSCNLAIVCSTYISRCLACFVLFLEYRSDFSRTFSFIISQRREGLTDSSFLYSSFVS